MLERSVLGRLLEVAILPAAEKTRSTPAEEAGAAKYCLTILASAARSQLAGGMSPHECAVVTVVPSEQHVDRCVR